MSDIRRLMSREKMDFNSFQKEYKILHIFLIGEMIFLSYFQYDAIAFSVYTKLLLLFYFTEKMIAVQKHVICVLIEKIADDKCRVESRE